MSGKRKETAQNLKHTKSSDPVELSHWYELIMWLLIKVAGWTPRCIGLHFLLTFSQMLHSWDEKNTLCRWMRPPKYCDSNLRSSQIKEMGYSPVSKSNTGSQPDRAAFQLHKTQRKAERPTENGLIWMRYIMYGYTLQVSYSVGTAYAWTGSVPQFQLKEGSLLAKKQLNRWNGGK